MEQTQMPLPDLNIETIGYGSVAWVNVEQPGIAEMQYLKETYGFHQLSLDDCLSVVQLPKVDEFQDHIFLVLHFPRFNKEARITRPAEVDVFASASYVVTVHDGTLRPLAKLFHDCQLSEEVRNAAMGQGSGFLLYRVIDNLIDYCFPILDKVIGNVNTLEEKVFDEWGQGVVREMALLRRDILAYRRIVRPQIEVLEAMEARRFPFLRVNPDIYFGDLADHMRRIRSELEDLREVVEGLHDSHQSMATLRTNDIIRTLTIAGVIILPLLLASSAYGMNVGLPGAGQWWAFPAIVLGTSLVSIAMLILFRLRRWL